MGLGGGAGRRRDSGSGGRWVAAARVCGRARAQPAGV